MKGWIVFIAAIFAHMGTVSAQTETCSSIDWHPDVLVQYPEIANDCQAVVERNGRYYAKLTANVVRVRMNGDVTLAVQSRDGTSTHRRSFSPPAGLMVKTPNKMYRWDELPRNYKLNFYIPSDRFELASFSDSEVTVDQTAEKAMEAEPMMLPKTASNQYAPLLIGALLALLGGALTIRRKLS